MIFTRGQREHILRPGARHDRWAFPVYLERGWSEVDLDQFRNRGGGSERPFRDGDRVRWQARSQVAYGRVLGPYSATDVRYIVLVDGLNELRLLARLERAT